MVLTASKILANGALGTSYAALYTAPASPATATFVTSIKFVNTNTTTARLVNLQLKKAGGSQIQWAAVDFSLAAKAEWEATDNAQQVRLGPGDEIYAKQDTGTDVSFTIMGGENQ